MHPPNMQQVVEEPWDWLGIDVTGPHPTSAKGNVFVLMVIDNFSKWLSYSPCRIKRLRQSPKSWWTVICQHGHLLQIFTDQGPSFESKEIRRMLLVDKVWTLAYRPSTNNDIEHFHLTLHSMMAKPVSTNQRNWGEWLPLTVFGYYTSVNETTPSVCCQAGKLTFPQILPLVLPVMTTSEQASFPNPSTSNSVTSTKLTTWHNKN